MLLLVLVTSFFPPAAFFIPLNRLFNTNIEVLRPLISAGSLYNTPYAIFIPLSAIFLPLSIFILMTFYSQIPDGLEDAARVEGTTRLGALFRVIVPLSAPGVATAGVLTFISVYNEYFFSSLMTDGQPGSWAPMLEGILRFQGEFEVLYKPHGRRQHRRGAAGRHPRRRRTGENRERTHHGGGQGVIMASVNLEGITKRYEDVTAVDDMTLDIEDGGEFVTFVGPSGCGKSTTMETIAGLTLPPRAPSRSAGAT